MFRKCLLCKAVVPAEEWQEHVNQAHNGKRKVLFKNVPDEKVLADIDEPPSPRIEVKLERPKGKIKWWKDPHIQQRTRKVFSILALIMLIVTIFVVVIFYTKDYFTTLAAWLATIWGWIYTIWGYIQAASLGVAGVLMQAYSWLFYGHDQAVGISTDKAVEVMGVQMGDIVNTVKSTYYARYIEEFTCPTDKDCFGYEKDIEILRRGLDKLSGEQRAKVVSEFTIRAINCKQSILQKLELQVESKAEKGDFARAAIAAIKTCKLSSLHGL